MKSADGILTIASRIRKVLQDKSRKDSVLDRVELPSRIEETIDKHMSMRSSSLMSPKQDTSDVNSDACERSFEDRLDVFFKVKEVGPEEEDEDGDEEFHSPLRAAPLSVVVDEEGDTFLDCQAEENKDE